MSAATIGQTLTTEDGRTLTITGVHDDVSPWYELSDGRIDYVAVHSSKPDPSLYVFRPARQQSRLPGGYINLPH